MSEVINNVVAMPNNTAVRIAETGILLECENQAELPRHDVVYALTGGRVGSAPLARYKLPTSLRGDYLIAPAATHEDGLLSLPQLAVIADRVAPWLAVHVVPEILCGIRPGNDFGRSQGKTIVEGRLYGTALGLACYDQRLILLVCVLPPKMAATLMHEIFHHLWVHHLSDDARSVLSAAVADGAEWPGTYLDSVSERTARLFQAWAWARMEGMPSVEESSTGLTVNGIFEEIWSGGLADHQIVRGLVPNAEALRVRRGLPELVSPAPEPDIQPVPERSARIDDMLCDWIWFGSAAVLRSVGRAMRRSTS